MLNVILPIFGYPSPKEPFSDENRALIFETVKERPIFAWALSHIEALPQKKRYFIITTDEFIRTYHIDKSLPLFCDSEINFVRLRNNTQGMPCSILMGADLYNLNEPFLVTSADQYINTDLQKHLDFFAEKEAVAGVIGFQSVHPKWSYADVDEKGFIQRIVEKVPISKNALTSSYYFSSGGHMIKAIQENILRGETVNDKYYLAPCLNELIIDNKPVAYSEIDTEDYFNFYSKDQIYEFKNHLGGKQGHIVSLTRQYAKLFNERDLTALQMMLSSDVSLEDSFTPQIHGYEKVVRFYRDLFANAKILHFLPEKIAAVDSDTAMINFRLQINDDHYEGVDILHFKSEKIASLVAYLHKTPIRAEG